MESSDSLLGVSDSLLGVSGPPLPSLAPLRLLNPRFASGSLALPRLVCAGDSVAAAWFSGRSWLPVPRELAPELPVPRLLLLPDVGLLCDAEPSPALGSRLGVPATLRPSLPLVQYIWLLSDG
jgi:hypothetical protein